MTDQTVFWCYDFSYESGQLLLGQVFVDKFTAKHAILKHSNVFSGYRMRVEKDKVHRTKDACIDAARKGVCEWIESKRRTIGLLENILDGGTAQNEITWGHYTK